MATKKGDDPKKKKVTAANTAAMTDKVKKAAALKAAADAKAAADKRKVTPANTLSNTDWVKKANKVDALSGTSLAPEGSEMLKKQDAYARQKIAEGTATSANRDARMQSVAARLKAEATADNTFTTRANDKFAGKFGK
jgi:hypothetical protein